MIGTDEKGKLAGRQPPPVASAEAGGPASLRLGDLYRSAALRLREAAACEGAEVAPEIATPDLDARLLVAAAAGLASTAVHRASGLAVLPTAAERLAGFLARRIGGEPVHRIIGRRAFYEHDFALSAETLEPRPETEVLVDAARPVVEAAIAERGACLFADVGTGTGAIAVSLLALYPEARAVAIDLSVGALTTARRNAEAAGVAERFLPLVCDHLSALEGRLDLVLSNPPYIPTAEIERLSLAVRRHDPLLALDGGEDGLDAYRAISIDAARLDAPAVILEVGFGQAADVEAIFAACGFACCGRKKDLADIERVVCFASAPA